MPNKSDAVSQSQFDDLMRQVDKLTDLVDEIHGAVIMPQQGGLFFQLNEIRSSIQAIEQQMSGGGAAAD